MLASLFLSCLTSCWLILAQLEAPVARASPSSPSSPPSPSTPSAPLLSLSSSSSSPAAAAAAAAAAASSSSPAVANGIGNSILNLANNQTNQATNSVRQSNLADDQYLNLAAKYVPLGNNTSSSLRTLNYAKSYIPRANFTQNYDLSQLSKQQQKQISDNQQQQAAQKRFEKICIGTANRMSGQTNKTDHYQNLVERYTNCTYVIGNLEITWLERGPDNRDVDLTFLGSIREITGYLLIAYVDIDRIRMPNLQIIRGRDLFKLNSSPETEYAIILIENEIKSLELPNLREILNGSVGSYNNAKLCHTTTINWDEILNGPPNKLITVYNGTQPECPACDASCQGGCWGEGPELCQKFSKTTCSPQCSQGRCYGTLPRECCHLFCAGGCWGPKQTDCFACKNFYDDGECIQECPSMMRYNPSKFSWEANPNGKYAFGATCVKECPGHLLRDNGACVRTCPENKRSLDGECLPCNGACPKNCLGVEVVHSGNIEQLINCTVIEGSITILDTSFTGYAEVYSNNTIGPRYKPMHPSSLEVFKTLREITGYLNIQASHSDFKNLSYFSNLKTIGGRQTTDMFYALSIIKTSLVSLNLRSLQKIRSGRITIEENRDLCFADSINWSQLNITKREDITIRNNAGSYKCRRLGLKCHGQCSRDGCWGPGPNDCLSCNKYKLDDFCVDNCNSTQSVGFLSYDAGNSTCKKCHPECKDGCRGTEACDCHQCKNFKDGPYCVSECPSHKFNKNGTCEECDKSCINGCTGRSNRLGEGGCNSCGKAVINSTDPVFVAHCIKVEESCPDGFYQEYVKPQLDGPLRSSTGTPVCRKCHHRCKSCTGMGTHVSVCKCARYQAGEQCEDYCPRDYFADEQKRRCIKCSNECNECFGPTEADCVGCRAYRVYYDSSGPMASAQVTASRLTSDLDGNRQVKFNCTAQCPENKPYRISESNMLDPYCSEDPIPESDSSLIVILFRKFPALLMIVAILPVIACLFIYKCKMAKAKEVTKLALKLSVSQDVEPLNPSSKAPNLAELRTIKETELRKGNILGEGFGGTVYQGLWHPDGDSREPKPVAIKVLHNNPHANKSFLGEAYAMASVNHPNLVKLLGICNSSKNLMLVTPLMPLGCLSNYVREKRSKIGPKNLLEWCKQIAKAMGHLEKSNIVHRDLALRNVLVQSANKVVISDFGLAKLLDIDQSEYHSGGGRLPIKWLAPECIRERKFTHKSDVWAFGVTIWELLTFGQTPYEGVEIKEIPNEIEKGLRLKQPGYMSAEVYKVMYACWFYNPEDRPDFETLERNFVIFARDPERYLPCGAQVIDYNPVHRDSGRNDSDEASGDELCSDVTSFFENENQQQNMPSTPGLTSSNFASSHNEFPASFELRHHPSNSSNGASQIPLTPTFNKSFAMNGHVNNQFSEDLFSRPAQRQHMTSKSTNGDLNNNNNSNNNSSFMSGDRFNLKGNSCTSVQYTASTMTLGQKSELPTDVDDYLLPSPCSNDDKFTEFLATHEGPSTRLAQPPNSLSFGRDPPHSAGVIGSCVYNDEYFATARNYVNSSGGYRSTNASTGHMPHSLV